MDTDRIASEFDAIDAIVEALEEAIEMTCKAGSVEVLDAQTARAMTQLAHLRGEVLKHLP